MSVLRSKLSTADFLTPTFFEQDYDGGWFCVEELEVIICQACVDNNPKPLQSLRHMLATCTDVSYLQRLVTEKYIQRSGVIGAVLANPNFEPPHITTSFTMNTLISKMDLETARPEFKQTLFYAGLVTCTQDIAYIKSKCIDMNLAVDRGYVDSVHAHTPKPHSLKFLENPSCTDEVCKDLIDLFFVDEQKELIVVKLAGCRPRLLEWFRTKYSLKVPSKYELAAISDVRYFNFTAIQRKDAAYILTHTSLRRVAKFICENYNTTFELMHGGLRRSKNTLNRIGYYKHLRRTTPDLDVEVTVYQSLAEIRELMKFSHVHVTDISIAALRQLEVTDLRHLYDHGWNLLEKKSEFTVLFSAAQRCYLLEWWKSFLEYDEETEKLKLLQEIRLEM
jgi:hypothetical protein